MRIEPVAYEAEGKLFYKIDIIVRDNHDRPVRLRKRRFRTVQEARKWAAQAALRVQAGERITRRRGRAPGGDLTASQVFEAVKKHLIETGVWRPSTAAMITGRWARIDAEIGNKVFSRLTKGDLERVRRLDATNSGPRLLQILLRIWQAAEKMGLPCPQMQRPNVHVRGGRRIVWLTREQAEALVAAILPRYRPLTILLLATGMRIGEALGLRPEDVSPDTGTITIARTWDSHTGRLADAPKTAGSRRIIPATDAVLQAIATTAPVGGRIFGAVELTAYRRALHQAGQAAGIPFRVTPHVLRHTHASWLLQAGADVTVVAAQLGHSSVATTAIYGHVSLDSTRAAVERIPHFTA